MAITIGVSGASGALGRIVAERLIADPSVQRLVLTTRTPDTLADLAGDGTEVRAADFDDPSTLPAAFAGIDRLLLISASNIVGDRIAQHGAAIDGARDAGIGQVIFTSMPRVEDPEHPIGVPAREYYGTEQMLASSGVPWVVLRNGPYMELNLVERLADSVEGNTIRTNTGPGGMAFVSRVDCAAAAQAVLTGEGHEGRIYEITGPATVTYGDVAGELTELLGRPIAYEQIDDATVGAHLRDAGVDGEMVTALVGLGRAIREGYFAGRTPDLETLTGSAGRPVAEVLREHRATLEHIFPAAG